MSQSSKNMFLTCKCSFPRLFIFGILLVENRKAFEELCSVVSFEARISENNGIYAVNAGAWTRTSDANTWDSLTKLIEFVG